MYGRSDTALHHLPTPPARRLQALHRRQTVMDHLAEAETATSSTSRAATTVWQLMELPGVYEDEPNGAELQPKLNIEHA